MKGDTSQNLIGLLERRLDMVVYRAKFAPTIWAARQLVNHGHVRVNGKKLNIASARVGVGDVVELGTKRRWRWSSRRRASPSATSPNMSCPTAPPRSPSSTRPDARRVPYPVRMEPNLVVEFYSR